MTRIALLSALSLFMLGLLGNAYATETLEERYYGNRIIVKMKPAEGEGKAQPAELTPDKMSAMAEGKRYILRQLKRTKLGASVLQLSDAPTPRELEQLASEINQRSDVEYAHVDYKRYPAAFADGTPTDTFFDRQWYLQDSATHPGATNANSVWSNQSGDGVFVAVIDTGYTRHFEFSFGPPPQVLNSQDFITADADGSFSTAGDLDGQDRDGSDVGDLVTQSEKDNNPVFADDPNCEASTSSTWHGTQVAGIIGARVDNGGITGIAPDSFVIMLRALGKCGGYISDIMDAALFVAGFPVPSAGIEGSGRSSADIINLSLGGGGDCTATEGEAIYNIVERGAVVVTAAGNAAGDANTSAPGNCTGTINVAAITREGGEASYTNTGTYVDISAPGGSGFADGCDTDGDGVITATDDGGNAITRAECNTGIITTTHDLASLESDETWIGRSTTTSDFNTLAQGTSFSAPVVTGIIALILEANAVLTPQDVYSIITETARAFPTGASDAPRDCSTERCGAGMLDAQAAVTAAESGNFTSTSFPIKSNDPSTYGGSGGGGGRSGEPFFGATGKGGGGGSLTPLLPLALLVLFGWRRARG